MRQALITEHAVPQEPRLDNLVARLDLDVIDLVLIEGFRHVSFPRIELHRKALGKTLLYPEDSEIIAVASDHLDDCGDLPSLNLNDTAAIAAFITTWLESAIY